MSIGTATPPLSNVLAPSEAFPWETHVPPFRQFTSDEFQLIVHDRQLANTPIELVDGWIVTRNARGPDRFSLRRWSVDEYHRLIELGVLKESEPVELVE